MIYGDYTHMCIALFTNPFEGILEQPNDTGLQIGSKIAVGCIFKTLPMSCIFW